jgi:hypothetical protein
LQTNAQPVGLVSYHGRTEQRTPSKEFLTVTLEN